MHKPLKLALLALATLLGLLILALAWVALALDPNDYKPLIVQRVQQGWQRTLDIPGPIQLSLFPRLGVKLGTASLSERGGKATFAALKSAQVSVALLPLLRKQVVVDRIQIDGLSASITRFKDGHTSIDDLLAPPDQAPADATASSGSATTFDVAGVTITNAAITLLDQQQGRQVELHDTSIRTGRIAPGQEAELAFKGRLKVDQPLVDSQIDVQGHFLLDPDRQHYAVRKLQAQTQGRAGPFSAVLLKATGQADLALAPLRLDVSGFELSAQGQDTQGSFDARLALPQLKLGEADISAQPLSAQATLKQGPRTVQLQLALPAFKTQRAMLALPAIDGQLSLDEGPLHAKARLQGTLEGDAALGRLHSPRWALTLEGQQGSTAVQGTVVTAWALDLTAHTAALSNAQINVTLPNPRGGNLVLASQGSAQANLAASTLQSSWAGKLDESSFDVKLGLTRFAPASLHFDIAVDRLDVDRYRAPRPAQDPAPTATDTPLDLAALRTLDATGALRVGSLRMAGVQAQQVRLDLHAHGGELALKPLSAQLYEGSLNGAVSVNARAVPQMAVQATLQGVQLGPLLQDALGKQPIEGRGQVTLDLRGQGATVSALQKSLAGQAALALRDGKVHGFNIAEAIRGAKSRFGLGGGQHSGAGSAAESTDFSEIAASLRIEHGVAHNDDLLAKTPLLRVAGSGDIDIGQSRLDYTVRATVVSTLQGQGGPELQALRGQTVPVRLVGPFNAIGYQIDFASVAKDLAQQALGGKAQEAKDAVKQQLGNKLKGLLGK